MRVRRRTGLIRELTSFGQVRLGTERALHNDLDFACDHWWGDRCPGADDLDNRNLDGSPVGPTAARCLVCRPYTADEDRALLEPASRAVVSVQHLLTAPDQLAEGPSVGSSTGAST